MTSWRRWIGLVLLAGLLAAALPAAAQGEVQVVTHANLSLRAAASSGAARLATVPYQTVLTATAISPDRNWVAVVYNEQGGWLSLTYTGVLSGSLGRLSESTQTFTAGGGGAVTSRVRVSPTVNLRYRTEPSLAVQPSGAIPSHETVPALAVSQDGLFVLVDYLGQNVWIYRGYVVAVTGSLDDFVPGAAPAGGEAAAPAEAGLTGVEAEIMAALSFERHIPASATLIDVLDCETSDLPSFAPLPILAVPSNRPVMFLDLYAASSFDGLLAYRQSVRRTLSIDGGFLAPQYVLEAIDLNLGSVYGSTEGYFWLWENPTPGMHEMTFTEAFTRPLNSGIDYDGDGAPDVFEGDFVNTCFFNVN